MNPEVLAILITVREASEAVGAIHAVKAAMGLTVEEAKKLKTEFMRLGAGALLMFEALHEAGTDEAMRLQLQALTHDGALAVRQIQGIREEAERGLFNKQEIFQAIKLFDETGSSIKSLLPLAEELGLRTGGGLQEAAKALSSIGGGGIGRLQGLLKSAGLSVRELREAGLAIDTHFKISSSPAQTLEALRKVLSKNAIGPLLGEGWNAELKGGLETAKELFRSIGDGLLPVAKPVLGFFVGLAKTLVWVNDLTGGWLANILLAMAAWRNIANITTLLIKFAVVEKLAVFWAGLLKALNNPWATLAGWIIGAANALRAFASVEKLAAAWAAVLDALAGNWVALAAGAVVAAAVGIAWHFANADDAPGNTPGGNFGDADNPPAQRPVRRSDIENQLSKTRARSFA